MKNTGIYALHQDMILIDAILANVPTSRERTDVAEIIQRRGRYFKGCVMCSESFTTLNVNTREGWLETQISGMCESCWDKTFAEPSDDDVCSICGANNDDCNGHD